METFCRIDLAQTNYKLLTNAELMSTAERNDKMELLQTIYKKYCRYKNFTSVMPLFPSKLLEQTSDVFAYYHNEKIVAFSLVKRYDQENAESIQFAWDYEVPELHLGIKSLEHECAYYKSLDYKFLYLEIGRAHV